MTDTVRVTTSEGEAAILKLQESMVQKLMAVHQDLFALQLLAEKVFALAYTSAVSSTTAALMAKTGQSPESLAEIQKRAKEHILAELESGDDIAHSITEEVIAKGREEVAARARLSSSDGG